MRIHNETRYYYRVRTQAGTSVSTVSGAVSAKRLPPAPATAPANFTATPGNAQVVLNWSPIDGVSGYRIFRSTTDVWGPRPFTSTTRTTSKNTVGPGGRRATVAAIPGQRPRQRTHRLLSRGRVNGGGTSALSGEREPGRTPPVADPATVAAFQFLRQATWPKPDDVDAVKNLGKHAFLASQLGAPASVYPNTLFNMPIEVAQHVRTGGLRRRCGDDGAAHVDAEGADLRQRSAAGERRQRRAGRLNPSAQEIDAALSSAPGLPVAFPNSGLGQQLAQVAQIIAVQGALGMNRQIFFAGMDGFDNHEDLVNNISSS